MLADINIKRIIRRHSRFNNIDVDEIGSKLILDIVKDCLHSNQLSKKDRDKKFSKYQKTMY